MHPEVTDTAPAVLLLIIAALGLTVEVNIFIAGFLIATAGALVSRLFIADPTRRSLLVTLAMAWFFAIVAALANQHFLGWPFQLAMGISGFISPVAVPWITRRIPMIADRALDRALPEKDDKSA